MEQKPSSKHESCYHLINKFFAFYGNWRFVTVFTTVRHRTLSRARWNQFTLQHTF